MRIALAVWVAVVVLAVSGRAVDWQQGSGFRRAALSVPQNGKPGFTRLPSSATGILFTNFISVGHYKTNQILLNGCGVAAGDVDGDGLCDIYLCRLEGDNALYRNLGNWRFENITAAAGVACPGMDASGALLADLDGDRDLDLVVNSVGHGTHVFYNDGKARFKPHHTILNRGKGGTSIAAGDLDGDGFLDLYVANYRTSALMDMPNTHFSLKPVGGQRVITAVNGRPVTDPEWTNRFAVNARGGIDEFGEPDILYRNRGGTNFVPWSFIDGSFLNEDGQPVTRAPLAWGLSVAIRDINHDRRPDLFVCNDFDSPDEIWINQGGGRFRMIDRLALRKSSLFSMGIDFADINRDGHDDFLVLDMLERTRVNRLVTAGDRIPPVPRHGVFDDRPGYMRNTLFLGRGDGTYAEIGNMAGLEASDWSWAAAFIDVDLDGWEDVLVSNGHERSARHMDVVDELARRKAQRQMTPAEMLDQRSLFPRLATPNAAFRNRGNLTFEKADWGFDFVGVSHGIALADLDNDGDQDAVVNNLNDPLSVYRNDAPQPRIAVRLRGKAPNASGIGARIEVLGGTVPQSQEVMAGGKYLSSDDPARTFAAGKAEALTVRVEWLSGRQSIVSNALPNSLYEISEDGAIATPATNTIAIASLFEDVSHLLNHSQMDTAFDDFARQPLLPYKLSQPGSTVLWVDVDNDSWDDVAISAGRGAALAVLRNEAGKSFSRVTETALNRPVERDQTSLCAWRKSTNEIVLLAGLSNYDEATSNHCVRAYSFSAQQSNDFAGHDATAGPVAMADIDADGDQDLFIGGRCAPGRYPVAVSSLLLRNSNGRFEADTVNAPALANIGMITGAAFADLDNDKDPDLVLACDWGPLRIFKNDGGRLTAWNPSVSVSQPSTLNSQLTDNPQPSTLNFFTGWWTAVVTADFDRDGHQDILACNWGRNTQYQNHRAKPLEIVQTDLDHDSIPDCMIVYYDEALKKRVPFRGLDFLGKAMPFLRERFTTHEAFARAGFDEIFPGQTNNTLQAAWLDSTVFLNRGDRFEVVPLPDEAQMSPALAVCAADFDGDDLQDIFLGQNLLSTHPESPRLDAGVGLVLLGKGNGKFKSLSAGESGVRVHGEQRGCAAADFDHDGRIDLAVTQNGAATKLFRNKSARPKKGI
jgi:enediyne biosynthesis protein E4